MVKGCWLLSVVTPDHKDAIFLEGSVATQPIEVMMF